MIDLHAAASSYTRHRNANLSLHFVERRLPHLVNNTRHRDAAAAAVLVSIGLTCSWQDDEGFQAFQEAVLQHGIGDDNGNNNNNNSNNPSNFPWLGKHFWSQLGEEEKNGKVPRHAVKDDI